VKRQKAKVGNWNLKVKTKKAKVDAFFATIYAHII